MKIVPLDAVAATRHRQALLLFLDTSVGRGGAVAFYRQLGWIRGGGVPDYAADPDGSLHANAIFYKRVARVSRCVKIPQRGVS